MKSKGFSIFQDFKETGYPEEFNTLSIKDTDEYGTPQPLFNKFDRLFKFTLDACASEDNHKVKRYYTKEMNGLIQSWDKERVWCNPPYSRGNLEKWVHKAFNEAYHGDCVVVMLLPNRTGMEWFRDYATKGHVIFLTGRVRHEIDRKATTVSPNFDSMILIFSKDIIERNIYRTDKNDEVSNIYCISRD